MNFLENKVLIYKILNIVSYVLCMIFNALAGSGKSRDNTVAREEDL